MAGAEKVSPAVLRGQLPPAFERWRVTVPVGRERPTSAREWAGALVRIESGSLEVDCAAGAYRRFVAGDVLALGWLPIVRLRNIGSDEVSLVAVRRCGEPPTRRSLRLNRVRR